MKINCAKTEQLSVWLWHLLPKCWNAFHFACIDVYHAGPLQHLRLFSPAKWSVAEENRCRHIQTWKVMVLCKMEKHERREGKNRKDMGVCGVPLLPQCWHQFHRLHFLESAVAYATQVDPNRSLTYPNEKSMQPATTWRGTHCNTKRAFYLASAWRLPTRAEVLASNRLRSISQQQGSCHCCDTATSWICSL